MVMQTTNKNYEQHIFLSREIIFVLFDYILLSHI